MKRLEIKIDYEEDSFIKKSSHVVSLDVSKNNNPYLAVKAMSEFDYSESSIGTPLSKSDARKMFNWLKKYLKDSSGKKVRV